MQTQAANPMIIGIEHTAALPFATVGCGLDAGTLEEADTGGIDPETELREADPTGMLDMGRGRDAVRLEVGTDADADDVVLLLGTGGVNEMVSEASLYPSPLHVSSNSVHG